MEELTKQQIVLVTLLVSFVTSIATGIVTVSLMDQAPRGVTQTINRVVEHTIERVVPNQSASASDAASGGNSMTAVISVQDQLADAVDRSSKSLVRIKKISDDGTPDKVTGFGIVVSRDGVIVTDKSTISLLGSYVAVFSDDIELPIQLFQSQNEGDIAFLVARPKAGSRATSTPVAGQFQPVSLAAAPLRLGETVFAIGGEKSLRLVQGFVATDETSKVIQTSINAKSVMVGSPIINSKGEFVGMKTASFDEGDSASFYPLSLIRSAIPKEGTFK
ncbi:MAG: hypothetical protein JWO73_568 [Candidatus Taylorbacteria bacterium]|nr:hypothetical protein [Candidatus Taylorbacteria bacterium]